MLVPQIIVRSKEAYPVAMTLFQGLVPSMIDSAVGFRNPIGNLLAVLFQDLDRPIGRTTIDHEQLFVGKGLPRNAVDAMLQGGFAIVGCDDDCYQRRNNLCPQIVGRKLACPKIGIAML